jgi:hypothetical protein
VAWTAQEAERTKELSGLQEELQVSCAAHPWLAIKTATQEYSTKLGQAIKAYRTLQTNHSVASDQLVSANKELHAANVSKVFPPCVSMQTLFMQERIAVVEVLVAEREAQAADITVDTPSSTLTGIISAVGVASTSRESLISEQ